MQLPRRRPDIFIKIIAELSKGKDGEQVKAIKMDKLIDQCEEKGIALYTTGAEEMTADQANRAVKACKKLVARAMAAEDLDLGDKLGIEFPIHQPNKPQKVDTKGEKFKPANATTQAHAAAAQRLKEAQDDWEHVYKTEYLPAKKEYDANIDRVMVWLFGGTIKSWKGGQVDEPGLIYTAQIIGEFKGFQTADKAISWITSVSGSSDWKD